MSNENSSLPPESDDYAALLEQLRRRVLERLVRAHLEFPPDAPTALTGDRLRLAINLHFDFTVVLERVLELKAEQEEMEQILAADPSDEYARGHKSELVWLGSMNTLANQSFIPYLKLSAHAFGLDPSPYVRCSENLTVATRADAIALSERLEMFADAPRGETSSPSFSIVSDALHVHDIAILKFLNKTPSIRRLISDVLPDEGPQNRGAITARLKRLAQRKPPLVDYPKKQAEGVAILPAGISLLKLAMAQESNLT